MDCKTRGLFHMSLRTRVVHKWFVGDHGVFGVIVFDVVTYK